MKERMTPELLGALRTVCVRELSYHPETGFSGAPGRIVEELLAMELIADIDRLNGTADFFLTTEGARLLMALDEGMEDVKNGNVRPYREAMSDIRKKIAER